MFTFPSKAFAFGGFRLFPRSGERAAGIRLPRCFICAMIQTKPDFFRETGGKLPVEQTKLPVG